MRRGWVVAAAVLVVAYFAVTALVDEGGGAPGGPAGSSYATQPAGVAAYADVLERAGHDVRRLRAPLDEDAPDPRWTVVLLGGRPPTDGEDAALARFVRRGGRLVTDQNRRGVAGPGDRVLRAAVPGLRTVRADGTVRFRSGTPGRVLLRGRGGSAAVEERMGRGTVIALADRSVLHNRHLGQADNAAFALLAAGDPSRPVAFVESVHGYAEERGLAALPAGWKTSLVLLAIAALVLLLAYGRRFGPPEADARELPPPRAAYVEAVAATLRRTRDRPAAAAPVRDAARAAVERRAGLPPGARGDDLRAAAARLGLPEDEARAVAGDADGDLLAAGRALARLNARGPT